MTHADWNVRIKRAMALASRRPSSALRTLRALTRDVEASLKTGVHEWHLAQTLQLMSLVQAEAGDHRGSAMTLVRLTNDHEAQLRYDVRAYVSVCAAAALQLAQDGNRTGARRILRQTNRWSSLLRPKDKLLERAQKMIRSPRTRNRRAADSPAER